MKQRLRHLLFFIIALNLGSALLGSLKQQRLAEPAIRGFEERTAVAVSTLPTAMLDNHLQRGSVKVISSGQSVSDEAIEHYFSGRDERERATTVYWKFRQPTYVTATAAAVDRRHYFVNSYLIGYAPFKVDAFWQPLYTVATRKTYQLDSSQYGAEEIWQNSAQAYLDTRGDCEDHAILLADWLIESGVDARVVLGRYKGEGHAWVVAFMEGEAFLLEATSKRRLRSWNAYPKAALSRYYQPQVMFNRHTFWTNSGSPDTRDYRGGHWLRVSTFSRTDNTTGG